MDASRPDQPTYVPAVVSPIGTREHSLRKYLLAMRETPDRLCGLAQRVGYTGSKETDFALYRLKVRSNPELPVITLSGFFVLENGIFRAYER
ncbi:MAG: hypothetical protein NVS4B11_07890 [Ktedonobacteraceae bacterium]